MEQAVWTLNEKTATNIEMNVQKIKEQIKYNNNQKIMQFYRGKVNL